MTAKRRSSPPVALVTGIAGFAGSHLAEELIASGYKVCGGVHPKEKTNYLQGIKSEIDLVRFDLTNPDKVERAIKSLKPDFVFHLAALASVWRSFEMERQVYRVNFEGTVNLLQAVKAHGSVKKVVFVSSADIYGIFKPKTLVLTEEQPPNPMSPYALSKVLGEDVCRYYANRHGLPVTISRSFAHCGPRQSPDFVVAAFAKQVAELETSRKKPQIKVGNLSPQRDMSDVRDIVSGYRLLAERGKPGRVYQLCSGKAVKIESILKELLRQSTRDIEAVTDPARLRKVDLPIQKGNNSRAVQELGYRNRYSLKTTLKDTLDYWRNRVQ